MTDMAGIVYDGSRVKVYELLVRLCEAAGENDEWRDTFWIELLGDEEIYCEFIYYHFISILRIIPVKVISFFKKF